MSQPLQPRYQQIADEIRQRIARGALPAGTPLPSESEMVAAYGASRETIRKAMATLRAEGIVSTSKGRGSFVRPQWPRRRLGIDRYRVETRQRDEQPADKATSFTKDLGLGWADYTMDKDFSEVPADAELAELLQVPTGEPLLRRHFVFRAHGIPQQISTSYLRMSMVGGTPVADPANEPWPGGNIAQLATLGFQVDRVRELVRTRMPLPDESRILGIGDMVPVLTITRTMHAGAQAVEAAVDIVLPGDRVELSYEIKL
jgi:GntR family transcriptional regulator